MARLVMETGEMPSKDDVEKGRKELSLLKSIQELSHADRPQEFHFAARQDDLSDCGEYGYRLVDNDRLLARATAWINAHFPEDVKMDYAQVFARRLRFNFARAKLAFGRSEEVVDSIADVLKFEGFDRTVMRAVSHLPMSSQFLLAWMTIRARPYGFKQLTRSLWRRFGLTGHCDRAGVALPTNLARDCLAQRHRCDRRMGAVAHSDCRGPAGAERITSRRDWPYGRIRGGHL